MNTLEQKYLALLDAAKRRQLPDLDSIRLCFQTLSLASAIDRDCAALLAPHGLSEGRFVLLFLLDAAMNNMAVPAMDGRAMGLLCSRGVRSWAVRDSSAAVAASGPGVGSSR